MKKNYIIVCGKVPNSTNEEGFITFTVDSLQEAKEAAMGFIQVIPDDLKDYQNDINDWNGEFRLFLSHADDDHFIFQVTPMAGIPKEFTSFITDYAVID